MSLGISLWGGSLFYEWKVTYGTISPLGVPQQVILINGEFPGPFINCTSNDIVVNVFNNIDEPISFHWQGIQQRKNSCQEGLPGPSCPIPPGTNYTYYYQVKDQIGSYYYYPSTTLHKAERGYGSIGIHNRYLLPIPFPPNLEAEFSVMIGSHTVQNEYDALDVHVGQCYSVLVTADQEPNDYFLVVLTRFSKSVQTSTTTICYEGGKGPTSPVLPEAPTGWSWSLNQFRSFCWNLTASAARPNPQGSYHYVKINITRTIKLANTAGTVDGNLRYAINGVSSVDPETPLKLAEYFGLTNKVFKYDIIKDKLPAKDEEKVIMAPNVIKHIPKLRRNNI